MVEADPRFRSLFAQLRSARTRRQKRDIARREMRRRRSVAPDVPPSEVEAEALDQEAIRDTIIRERFQAMGFQAPVAPPVHQFEAARRFGLLEGIPPSEYKYYEGGHEYLQQLPPREQKRIISGYTDSPEYQEYLQTPQGREQYKVILQDIMSKNVTDTYDLFGYEFEFPKSRSLQTGGYGYWKSEPGERVEAKRKLAKHLLFTPPGEESIKIFDSLSFSTQLHRSIGEIGASATSWFVSLPQMGVKYLTGGKTLLLPDVEKELSERRVSPVQGLITTGIGEGVGAVTGKSPGYWETAQKYPWLTVLGTGAEITGFWMGGKALHTGKVATLKGLGKIRSGVRSISGVELPGYEKISYYFPHRIVRRGWVRFGTKNIDDIMGKPYHSVDTLTPKGLSYAPGSTPKARISWTIGKTRESKGLFYSPDEYLVGSASGQRIGMRFVIKPTVIHELPGISTAPYGYTPIRFYRFGASGLSYSSRTSLLPSLHRPSGLAINLRRIVRPPKFNTYDDIIREVRPQPKGSWGMVSPKMYLGGPESEINIFGKTILKRYLPSKGSLLQRLKGYQYYTDVPLSSGLREVVPVVFTRPIHKGFPSGFKTILDETSSNVKNFIFGSSYTGVPTTSIISPGVILSKAFASSSYNISAPSGLKSVPSISSPSIPSSISISGPSFPSRTIVSRTSVPSSINISGPSIPSSVNISSPSLPSVPSAPSVSVPSSPSVPSRPSIYSYPASGIVSPIRGRMRSRPVKAKQGYHVEVKDRQYVKGKKRFRESWSRMTKYPTGKFQAYGMGGYLVDNSAAAAFRVVPGRGPARDLNVHFPMFGGIQYKFYPKGDRMIENTAFRIDSGGELEQITAKGILSNMMKAQGVRHIQSKPKTVVIKGKKTRVDPFTDMFKGFDRIFNMKRVR